MFTKVRYTRFTAGASQSWTNLDDNTTALNSVLNADVWRDHLDRRIVDLVGDPGYVVLVFACLLCRALESAPPRKQGSCSSPPISRLMFATTSLRL